VEATLALDKLDFWARTEHWRLAAEGAQQRERELFAFMQHDPQLCLDLAFDYAEAGLWDEAVRLLEAYLGSNGAHYPMVFYALSYFFEQLQKRSRSDHYARLGALAPSDYCFPSRLPEMLILEWVCEAHPSDAKAPYYLGNLLYDKRRYEDAIQHWERSVALDSSFAIPWRNLSIAYFNIRHDVGKARDAYSRALIANPVDARVFYELDQLEKRIGVGPRERLARLETQRSLVEQRDDLTVELVTLYNQTGQSQKALDLLASRRFNPWEGGEGLVSGQYVSAHLLLGRLQLESGNAQPALTHFEAARNYPLNLGEGKHLLTPEVHLDYFSGLAAKQLDRDADARAFWTRAAQTEPGISWMRFYQAMALAKLGREAESRAALQEIRDLAERQMHTGVKIDYFATSLPNFLLFEDDLQKRNQVDCLFVMALAELGLGNTQTAENVLRQVLSLDCNHLAAQEELRALMAATQCAAGLSSND
jgi:tetratricopeptide (TPR) repeat protein